MDTLQGTWCYLCRSNRPDYSDIQDIEYDWECSVYGHVSKLVPDDAAPPLGKPVIMTTYIDANLYHDLITGHAATGIAPTPC